jgi:D-alanine--poly(phosphoribitol) ligase subunit 1
MLLNTSIAFDISLLEMLLPLVVGGTVVCAPKPTVDVDGFRAAVARFAPTHVQGTPTFFSYLERLGWPLPEGAEIWCGGEPLGPRLAVALVRRFRQVRNMYGPTEATIWCTYHDVTEDDAASVGRPFGGSGIFIEPTGDSGDVGEVVVFGAGLAAGYVDPQQNEDRFFHDPRRGPCYRTGDLGWLDLDGRLHVLGRRDDQVKVNGHRIELGDIEANLESHPSVHRCAVVVSRREDAAQLVAYVMADELGLREMRSFARERLPLYAVPHRFRFVDALPVNTAGKIDRRQLYEREHQRAG